MTMSMASALSFNQKPPIPLLPQRTQLQFQSAASLVPYDSAKNRSITRSEPLGRKHHVCCISAPRQEVGVAGKSGKGKEIEYIVKEFGWGVRKLYRVGEEVRMAAYVQAEAFYEPMAAFNSVFYEFYKAEVLSDLMFRMRNSASDRYACLVAESVDGSRASNELVGIADLTVQRDLDVLVHLKGADEYLYVSGIAVLKKFRRKKVGTVLLKACDALSHQWRYNYLALRAYEDDIGARQLYSSAGYEVVSRDPDWMTWFGMRRRVLMIKQSNFQDF